MVEIVRIAEHALLAPSELTGELWLDPVSAGVSPIGPNCLLQANKDIQNLEQVGRCALDYTALRRYSSMRWYTRFVLRFNKEYHLSGVKGHGLL